jgi:hypothetical protein
MDSLIERRFRMVVPVFEPALRANVELDSDLTSHLALVGMLAEINLSLFFDHVRPLAENTHLRFLARQFHKHLCTYPNRAITLPGRRAINA